MNHARRILLAVSVLLAFGLLSGCKQSSVAIGWVASQRPGHWEASYTTFTGSKIASVPTDAGEALTLEYTAEVDKGSLIIEVQDPDDEVLWDVTLRENAAEIIELRLDQDGRHAIVVRGDDAGGSFVLSWEVRWRPDSVD